MQKTTSMFFVCCLEVSFYRFVSHYFKNTFTLPIFLVGLNTVLRGGTLTCVGRCENQYQSTEHAAIGKAY